jgi:hypothetical protein
MVSTGQLFSRPIGFPERQIWLKTLGLSDVPFVFKEWASGKLLRVLEVSGNGIKGVITEDEFQYPIVTLRHHELFPKKTNTSDHGLLERLFPYPWSHLMCPETSTLNSWEFSHLHLKNDFHQLGQKVLELEQKLKQAELGCLQLIEGQTTQTFLFHFVAGKILRSGCSKEDSLNMSSLQKKVASMSFARIEVDKSSNLRGFDLSLFQLENAISSVQLRRLAEEPLNPTLDLPLEL